MASQPGEIAYWALTYRGAQLIERDTLLGEKVFGHFGDAAPQPDIEGRPYTVNLGSILVAAEASCAFDPEQIGISEREIKNYTISPLARPYYGVKGVLSGLKDAVVNRIR